MTTSVRNARAEAQALLPAGHEARVLEPSPPADTDPAWYADDPTASAGSTGVVVSPTSDGDLRWDDVAGDDPALAAHARDHWLSRTRVPDALPTGFAATRRALHQVAFFAVAPRRHAATGKLGLRWTFGGFGTPFFATDEGDEQVRVEGDRLVVQTGDTVRSQRLSTVAAACDFIGIDHRPGWFDFHDPPAPFDPGEPLHVDASAARALGDWFGFATAVLEELRRTEGAADVGRVQLWPEHFDPAVELGSADAGQRASYGASPGDDDHAEPYLYVSAWGSIDRSRPYWNDGSFNGASLAHDDLLRADDPWQAALDFLRRGHDLLTGQG